MSNPSGNGQPWSWHVTTQVQQAGRADNGAFVPGVLIGFETDNGHQGTIFLPQAQYTPEAIAAAVSKRVQLMRDVGGLTGAV